MLNSSKNSIQHEKFSSLNKDQQFVNEILDRAGLEVKWLYERVKLQFPSMEYDDVLYQLRKAVNYRQDFHKVVVEILRREGLVSSSKESIDKLKDELIDFSQILSGTVSLISKGVKERLSGGIDETEKIELKQIVRAQSNRILDVFNDLLLTIDMQ